jgi:Heterokaryon incompatibility protein (HET)
VKGHKNGTLSITANLAEALKYLRNSTAARLLWIDAICINQQDLEERGRQVRLMAKIYSRARRVILWVGPKSEDSDLAVDCISKIASRVGVRWQTTHLYPITDESDWADHDVPLPLSDIEHSALFRFYSRSWFKRLWVWQEVHLATDAILLCGVRSVDWKAVRTGVICMGVKPRPGMVEWPAPEPACKQRISLSHVPSSVSHWSRG